jgi:DNA-binding Lrp family transcriptional regulator
MEAPGVSGRPKTELVARGRGSAAEAQRDAEVLRWVGRFRFVTDELLADRFGVSRQQMNLRVRRLADAGLVERTGPPMQPRLTMLTRRGARAVDLPVRRAPRTDQQREHELAVVWLVIQIERAGDILVRTERECRTLEAQGDVRHSIPVVRPGRPDERRWPDVVLDGGSRRSALELELSAKGTSRLQAIVDAYARTPTYDEAIFLAVDASIARRLARCMRKAARPVLLAQPAAPARRLRVVPWPGLSDDHQRLIAAAIAEA